jgi:hypothetical protein
VAVAPTADGSATMVFRQGLFFIVVELNYCKNHCKNERRGERKKGKRREKEGKKTKGEEKGNERSCNFDYY